MTTTLPLDRNAMKAVRSALALLLETEPMVKLAEQAGFNAAEERARLEHYKGLATQILAVYEPIVHKLNPIDS